MIIYLYIPKAINYQSMDNRITGIILVIALMFVIIYLPPSTGTPRCDTISCGAIRCYNDTGCPPPTATRYCIGNITCSNSTTYRCANPGTFQSRCEIVGCASGCAPCSYGCRNGTCLQNVDLVVHTAGVNVTNATNDMDIIATIMPVIRNIGTAGAGASRTKVVTALGNTDQLLDTPPIAAGALVTIGPIMLPMPAGTTYTVAITADALDEVWESNEANNRIDWVFPRS